MSIRQKTYADGRKSGVWRISFRDHAGAIREISGYESKRASEDLDRLCRRLVECRIGGGQLSPDDARRLRDLDPARREKLSAWGVIDATLSVSSSSLADLVTAWETAMVNAGAGDRWDEKAARVIRALDGAGMGSWNDLCRHDAPERLLAWLANERRSKRIGERTEQHYLQGVKQFCRWVRVARWAASSPVESIPGKTKVRPVRERRILTPAEFGRLVRAGAERDPMAGLAYGLAGTLGCDASTLREITRGHVERVEAGVYQVVHRRRKTGIAGVGFVVDPVIVALLEQRLAEVGPGVPLVKLPRDTAKMIRVDLEAAGVAYKDEAGRFADFHALRAYAATQITRSGASLKTAQTMLGHASAKTTAGYYTHAVTDDMLEAAKKLPKIVDPSVGQSKMG